ncbi:alpha-galactosidase [Pricia antarctica]|uniref:Alpha-galactosidase n=1 Tax=Pricia antarctica TaxID=641691 RepID=A0A1G7HUZ8_9FLAO|nr:glycoside hydrolase family 36 protein [Pricia antarctica]SDF04024.1 alpha-galactosidase [Pricia antarctica]
MVQNRWFLFVLMLLAFTGIAQTTGIVNGNLKMEVDGMMKVRLSSTFKDAKPLMDGFVASEKLVMPLAEISDFKVMDVSEGSIQGDLKGKQWVFTGVYQKNGIHIEKRLTVKEYDGFPDLLSTQVSYVNKLERAIFVEKWVNNAYKILSQGDAPAFWAFQGSSTDAREDWIKPLQSPYFQQNYLGQNMTDYGGGIPVTDLWRKDVGIAVGHLAMVPKLVSLPTEVDSMGTYGEIGVSKKLEDRTVLEANGTLETEETFVMVHQGDYYNALSEYSNLMQAKGITMPEREDAAFESIWCAWGYERKFTADEVIGTLPKVKELGIKWAVLDDGFQIAEGDWNADPKKFPRGNIEITEMVDKIHEHGLKAKVWWTPLAADPGSKALVENPDMRIFQKDGSPEFITWWDAYYLSPANPKTIQYTEGIIDLFMNEYGFDAFKMDGQHMNGVLPDYNQDLELDYPEESVEKLPDFFQMIYDQSRKIKPHAVIENCPCGTCMSYFNMASMNQAVSSDPLSSWQIRHKGKTYKALIPQTAYYGDHVELSDNGNDFASSFGIGAVLGTKFTWPNDNPDASDSFLLTPEKEKVWKKWFSLYDQKMLSKEKYLGSLYDIGYDKPETHVIEKEGNLYYAFYADDFKGTISLKGLEASGKYTVTDYFNEVDMGTVSGKDPKLDVAFKQFLLIEVSPKGKKK